MATIVNNPGNSDSGAVAGLVTAAIVIVALGLVAFFVWPGYSGSDANTTNINVEVPALDAGAGGVQ